MHTVGRACRLLAGAIIAVSAVAGSPLTAEEKEAFLRSAAVLSDKVLSDGVTRSRRATLELNGLSHDGHIQTVDVALMKFESKLGQEFNFRDNYIFNVAAYELAKLLGIADMVPPSVVRKVGGREAAVTWWVDDVLADEGERRKKKVRPPDPADWNEQIQVMQVFDELIFNTDRNLGNFIIDRNWRVWMIDHTRAFRLQSDRVNRKMLARCDRQLLERLRQLTREDIRARLGNLLKPMEIDGLMKRRDRIVRIFDEMIATHGEQSVLYDRRSRL